MDVREKLVELILSTDLGLSHSRESDALNIADNLIANGVTVQELNGCDFCQKFDFAGARAEVNKYGAHISLAICNTKFPDEERFKFCPMCGRELAKPPKGE